MAVAVVVGVVFGPLDLAGQIHTPYPFANLFNSPAVWAAVAFGFGVWAHDPSRSVVGAIVAMVVAVESYYIADVVVRGSDVSVLTSTTAMVWLVLGVGAGLVFGGAGGMVRDDVRWRRILALALLPAVFASEAAYQVIEHLTTDANQGRDDAVQFAVLLALCAAASLVVTLRLGQRRDRAAVVATTLALTVLGTVAYVILTS